MQKRYGFKAHVFHVAGVENKEEYSKQYGTDLFLRVKLYILVQHS
jgi:hypothetical protein